MAKLKRSPYRFGEKIRKVREQKGQTLKVVAQSAGVSESLVSQIERNRVSPAIDTLLALADVLDINLEYLFEEYRRNRPVQIVRSTERRTIKEEEIVYEELANPSKNKEIHAVESYIVIVPPGEQTHRGSYGHLGREIGFILEGGAQFTYEANEYFLEKGDSISFSACSPHVLINPYKTSLRALWVVTPPQRFI
ncbi:MAG TPA: XRE family transcriptional regulator [Treponemataceae bacterium]|nr:XRE family transcriptional regulator [Treponemataceae bacterium]